MATATKAAKKRISTSEAKEGNKVKGVKITIHAKYEASKHRYSNALDLFETLEDYLYDLTYDGYSNLKFAIEGEDVSVEDVDAAISAATK